MAYEQRDNSGTIFNNDRKEKESHPDRSGTAMIDGKMYYVSGWIKSGKNGKFLSLAFKPKDEAPQHRQSKPDPISSGKTYHNLKERPLSKGEYDEQNARIAIEDEIPF